MSFHLLSLLLLSGVFTSAAAQAEYWKYQDDSMVAVKIGFAEPKLEMTIEDKNRTGKRIIFVPNSPSRTYIGVSHRWIGGSVSWAMPRSNEENRIRGSTKSNDWQFRFNFKNWQVETFYQQYKGYYIENTSDFQPHSEGMSYLQAPDLSNESTGLSISYVTHPETFSMSAAFDQNATQMESGWSWIFSGAAGHHRFDTPASLVPTTETGTYGDFELVRAARLYSVLAGAGAGGTLVISGPWYLSGVLVYKVGIENQSVTRTDKITANSVQASGHSIKIGFGYNGDRALFGMGIHASGTKYNIENATMNFSTMSAGFYAGARIKF